MDELESSPPQEAAMGIVTAKLLAAPAHSQDRHRLNRMARVRIVEGVAVAKAFVQRRVAPRSMPQAAEANACARR
jgi:hypothetical protein